MTSFNEEYANIGTFVYVQNGFRYKPTSYYGAPFWFAYKKHLKHTTLFCANDEPLFKTTLDQIKNFVYRMNNKLNKNMPYFSYNVLNMYNHDYLDVPESYDLYLKQTIEEFNVKGYLNNTLLIMMGDHGPRLDQDALYSDLLKFEESWPLLSITLPKLLENSPLHKRLVDNKKKLTSHFDIYKTLVHFYYINKNNKLINEENEECKKYLSESKQTIRSLRGVSLFENVNTNRSCKDAIITERFCLCNLEIASEFKESEFVNVTKVNLTTAISEIINTLNSFTDEYRTNCKLFSFEKIEKIKKISFDQGSPFFQFYMVVQPGNAIFQADYKIDPIKNRFEPKNIIRISLYKNESDCMKIKSLYGFCFCI